MTNLRARGYVPFAAYKSRDISPYFRTTLIDSSKVSGEWQIKLRD